MVQPMLVRKPAIFPRQEVATRTFKKRIYVYKYVYRIWSTQLDLT